MKKSTLMAISATTLGVTTLAVVGLLGFSQVSAEEIASNTTRGPQLLIENLASKFGVSEDEVKEVFEATKEAHRDQKLDSLVEDGTLTQEQRDSLEAKIEEMKERKQEIMNTSMTAEERRTAMEELRSEMKEWAEENGIELPEKGRRDYGMRKLRFD